MNRRFNNRNAMRHGLRAGVLRKGASYIKRETDTLRRSLEDVIADQNQGNISLYHAALINSVTRRERHAMLAQRWLRQEASKMDHSDRLAYMPVRDVTFTAANLRSMCSAVLEPFSEGTISLFPHPQLIADIRALRVEEKSYGCRLVSPRTTSGHGDAATALAITLHLMNSSKVGSEPSFRAVAALQWLGDELWIYYFGSNRNHDGVLAPASKGEHFSGVGYAVVRLDGLVPANAGYAGGEQTTPLIRVSGRSLELNVDTGGGRSVRVEFMDETGQSLPGYSQSYAIPVIGNSVSMPVMWKGESDVSEFAGRTIRLHFSPQCCQLYAFQFVE